MVTVKLPEVSSSRKGWTVVARLGYVMTIHRNGIPFSGRCG